MSDADYQITFHGFEYVPTLLLLLLLHLVGMSANIGGPFAVLKCPRTLFPLCRAASISRLLKGIAR